MKLFETNKHLYYTTQAVRLILTLQMVSEVREDEHLLVPVAVESAEISSLVCHECLEDVS